MFSDPNYNVEQFDLQSGSKVADLGSGSGFYALSLARAVGDRGRVYAVEIQKNLLETLRNEALKKNLTNLDIIWGNLEEIGGTKIKDEFLDAVVVANVFFQVLEKKTLVKEIYRILKRGGRALIIDWTDSFGGLGPVSEAIFSDSSAREMFEQGGFKFERRINAGEHHYGLIFKKA